MPQNNEGININALMKSMENMWNKEEECFEMTEALSNMDETCPEHGLGMRDILARKYICPVCKRGLYSHLRA